MDYLEVGNDSHLVVGSVDKEMDGRSGKGLVELLLQVSKALNRRMSEELEGIRLKPFMALQHVHDRGSVSQQELESALLIDANSVVLILNELEAAGYSVRRRDPSDRRRHLVEITESGRAAVERAEKSRAIIEDEVLTDLSPEERETLKKVLRRVLDGLLAAAPDAAKA
jgi:DNA-binding MarR family transcriptional regulator